jgi:hypothetical protein
MISHNYLVLGAAAVWIVTNFLGAAFTIKRLYARGKASRTQPASHSRAGTQYLGQH